MADTDLDPYEILGLSAASSVSEADVQKVCTELLPPSAWPKAVPFLPRHEQPVPSFILRCVCCPAYDGKLQNLLCIMW